MPEFTNKPVKLLHKGMQWNTSVDSIPDGQVCFGLNVRTTQVNTVTQRPGLTLFASLLGSYLHSIAVLNNFNTGLVGFSKVYVIGEDTSICVGDTAAHLANVALNPVKCPPATTTPFSGNPLTMVDMAPVGTYVGWKYIGDSNLNISVGYYPADSTASMARALTMGMTPPVNQTTLSGVIPGNLTGSYQWIFAYRNEFTGARSNPSAPTRNTLANPAITVTNKQVAMTLPTTPIDPQTGAADAHILIDVYRFGGTINDWRYVGTGASGALFVDSLPDSAILTASTPPEVTDPTTGVTRFNLYRPFVVQDNARYSSTNGTVSINGTGKWILTAGGADTFDLNWLPGSIIGIAGGVYNIFQVIDSTHIEVTQDLSPDFTNPTNVAWATQTGTLKMGAPLPHIWGPYGTGQGGAYIFGCGGSVADAGTLYWTNGNDPDSTDIVNSLVVTSPSEPLRGGCVYDGTPFVWSTERMFRIYPGTVAGQFLVQEIPGGKGLWAEYSLTVQSNAVADQSVSWVGKDGIYDWSTSGGLQSLTDRDLYSFFPHDNIPGVGLPTLFPFLNFDCGVPDFTIAANRKYHRLCWFQGLLHYDFPGIVSAANRYSTLVYDTKEAGGWVSLDQLFATGAAPQARGIEIAGNNLLVSSGSNLYSAVGSDDAGTAILGRLVTKQDDQGDTRGEKLYADVYVDLDPGGSGGVSGVQVIPRINYAVTALNSNSFTVSGRAQHTIDLSPGASPTGLGLLSRTFGLDFQWTGQGSPVILYGYSFSYVPKPNYTNLRATDKTDDGYNGAKYLRGLCIEANTDGVARTVKVLVDGTVVGTLTVNTTAQVEAPYAISPPATGTEFQLQPTDAAQWQLFQVRWTWDKFPDFTVMQSPWLNLGSSKPKYIRSFTIPVIGNSAVPLTFSVNYDGATVPYVTPPVAPAAGAVKTGLAYPFIPPIVAHELTLTPSAGARAFYDEIIWDAEEWPESEFLYGPIENLGTSGAKYLRGFELPMETGGTPVAMTLYYDNQPTSSTGLTQSIVLPTVSTTALSKNVFPFTPIPPIIAHEFQLQSGSAARFWYGEVKWDFEQWPEFSDGVSAWMDAGTPAAKFMQGLVIATDTGGQNVQFTLVYDGGSVQIGPFNTPAGRKTPVPFSFPVPFIAHEFQLSPSANCRVWYEEIEWVFEPVPELVTTYTTQETDHDLPGYHYLFDAYIAYIGTGDVPTFTVKTEYGTLVYPLPATVGYTRAYLLLQPQKAKWRSYSIQSSTGIRLFLKDCEVRAKTWSDKGIYPASFQSLHPFGGDSRVVGARI